MLPFKCFPIGDGIKVMILGWMDGVMDIDIFYVFWLLNYLFKHWSVTCGVAGQVASLQLHFFVVSRKYFFCT